MKKILILSANPQDTNKLRLDREVREIQAALKRAKNREKYEIITEWAVRIDDLRRVLLDHQPTIVHFSGHGSGNDGLALENNFGQTQLISTESLAKLFGLFQGKIECVLLNACYSQAQVAAIHQHIDCVVGMNQAIGDVAATEFAIGFYDALGAGRSYEDCFEVGCASIDLQGIPESDIPVIKVRRRSLSCPEEISHEQTGRKINSTDTVFAGEENSQLEHYGRLSQNISGVQMYGNGMQVVQGKRNQQNMSIQNVAPDREKQLTQQEVVQLLLQIEQLIQSDSQLPAVTKEKSLRYLGAAREEAQLDEPDKQLTAGNLKRMTEILKISSETVSSSFILWDNIKLILTQIHTWLGVANNFFGF
ncbi:MAG: CHAT domain-containing protein [Rhizonema sp. PD37]|nr:CHAT domain-containing protein [Rhizonema sp. PD37]